MCKFTSRLVSLHVDFFRERVCMGVGCTYVEILWYPAVSLVFLSVCGIGAMNLKVTGSSLFVTFNCACAWTILYRLWTDAISAIEYVLTKNSLWIWWDLVTNILFNGQCRAWRSHFKNIIGFCNFTEAKSREVGTVLVNKWLFLKNRTTLPKKRSVRPSSRLKTVNLDYCSSLSVARLVRFWFKNLQSFTG